MNMPLGKNESGLPLALHELEITGARLWTKPNPIQI